MVYSSVYCLIDIHTMLRGGELWDVDCVYDMIFIKPLYPLASVGYEYMVHRPGRVPL